METPIRATNFALRVQTTKKSQLREVGFFKIGRRERIRTFDPLHPMQVRYQAALHAEKNGIIA
jgi:hypothetical protein